MIKISPRSPPKALYNLGFGGLIFIDILTRYARMKRKIYVLEIESMIHTFTIKHKVDGYYYDIRRVAEAMSIYDEDGKITSSKISDFYNWTGDPNTKDDSVLKVVPKIPGIEEIVFLNQRCFNIKTQAEFSQYWLYIRMEPLTLITGEQHIALFECTKENIERLVTEFRTRMSVFLGLDETRCRINSLAEFGMWEAWRVDYTIDVRMLNKDEVLAFINLAKMSVISNKITEAKYTSIHGEHFYNDSFKYGDDTKELQIYDKQRQLINKQEKDHIYPDEVFCQLLEESNNIARIEYRRLKNGTKKNSTKFNSRSIMQFLDETLAHKWLMDCYGSTVGFEDFYREYHARKRLAEGFPMTDKEKETAAHADSEGAEKVQLGNKAEAYRKYMINIVEHRGRQNALNDLIDKKPEANPDTIKRRFTNWSDRIRERAHISPVLLPDNWRNRKGMELPTTYLENPLKDLR